MEQIRILIVEDEEPIRKLIYKILSTQDMLVYQAQNGSQALEMINKYSFDLVLLDILMDDISGYDVAREIRKHNLQLPIIFLSGKKDDEDIIKGLDIGADSYITKPFSPSVLSAQVKSKIKRRKEILHENTDSNIIVHFPFKYDLNTYKFYKNDIELKLSSKETKLMKFFMEHPNQVFSKEQLYQSVWQGNNSDDNSIMVYIKYLRNKIEDIPRKPKHIKTVWGIGYEFCV
ncbi:PhoB family transcriptional regulator [Clostridium carboxidivorans P7]|uniref:Stage 0 sporulation protein A homolog n=1 Tax=Clostridium carboxidivorans P7 TaxID=536227 RepID=C6Q0M5_9CLOT|nr:response regulator transcription factor [Clostridium carboxidivorans]AKN32444.1 PhoB family transcriptional regulator [Clostridium carboxidivorans P7]EET84962.1 two component transcriptional regulator, winged helix family [Clostridium carboxidivorans P7]EFG87687.1 putative regulatory protein VanR [Clostridium carboxidivorans P7]EFG87692.1 putative regulatory protein VanR [Clostridium carboxidivorans P7]